MDVELPEALVLKEEGLKPFLGHRLPWPALIAVQDMSLGKKRLFRSGVAGARSIYSGCGQPDEGWPKVGRGVIVRSICSGLPWVSGKR